MSTLSTLSDVYFDQIQNPVYGVMSDLATGNFHVMSSKANGNFIFHTTDKNFIATTQININVANAGLSCVFLDASYFLGFESGHLVWRDNESHQIDLTKNFTQLVLQIERTANQLILSFAGLGKTFESIIVSLDCNNENQVAKVGLFAQSDLPVDFTNTRLVFPAWKGLVPYTDYIGSRLEILDVETGQRNIVYHTIDGIEAPNWTPDGNKLIFNSKGRLFYFDLQTKQIDEINTGFAVKNNNDHVLSFDGSLLGISHHAAEHNGDSIVYLMNPAGGVPKALTLTGPSFLHGISPDNHYVIYTARRNGKFNIYRTTTDGVGKETQMTFSDKLDDGSEYSPDGKAIFFNSAREGKMEIWRVDAHGNNPVRLTQDGLNDWFPHVSPDMKQIIFLSYLPSMDPDKHPYYQHVYLRLMSYAGGNAKVVAYLYGGQGTINVPSWSPDSRYVAFVSNSQMGDIKN